MLTGVCESYFFIKNKCNSGEELTTINLISLFFDPPSILLISIITILGSAFRGHGLISSIEKASHLAKDVGELGTAIGAIHTFMGVFNESAISQAFGYVFSAYFPGLSISLICSTIVNYLRLKKLKSEVKIITPVH